MPKYTTTKFVEASLLNKKTGMPTSKRIDLPFGAVISDPEEDDRYIRFTYLGELYHVPAVDLRGYYHPVGVSPAAAESEQTAAKTPAAPPAPTLEFHSVKSNLSVKRAKAPGGWIVVVGDGVTFVPDPAHKWDGGSV